MSASIPKIIYIMGTGRSGTTILEILLTNNPRIVGIGEATHIFKDGFMADSTCACGEKTYRCKFWSAISRRCGWKKLDMPMLSELFQRMAWHTRFPFIALNLLFSKENIKYREVNECIFNAVYKETSVETVIDSSKYASRALALARAFPSQVYILCLTRSPAGLLTAFQKPDAVEQRPKSLLATFAYYFYVILCLRITIWLAKRPVFAIRFEDLVNDPVVTLTKIERWCGSDFSEVKNKILNNEWLSIGHIVTGNRLRKEGRVRFRRESNTQCMQGMKMRFVAWCMNLCRLVFRF